MAKGILDKGIWIAASAMPPRNDGGGCHRERSAAIQLIKKAGVAVIASAARRSIGLKRHLIKGILDKGIWIAASASPVVRLTGLLRCARNDGVAVIASAARRSSGLKRHLIKGILDKGIWIAASALPPRNDGGAKHLLYFLVYGNIN